MRLGGAEVLVLTNNSQRTPKELEHRLKKIGLKVGADHRYPSIAGEGAANC